MKAGIYLGKPDLLALFLNWSLDCMLTNQILPKVLLTIQGFEGVYPGRNAFTIVKNM